MVYLTQKNIELIRAVIYLLRKNYALTAYKKENLIRILSSLIDENTLLSHLTTPKNKNKKIIKNYAISPSFNMTILKEEPKEEELEGEEKGQNKIILYKKIGNLEEDEYIVKEKDISPGKCLAIDNVPGTISHDVRIIKNINKVLPWKYKDKSDIILPPKKLWNWDNVDSDDSEDLLTVTEHKQDNNNKNKYVQNISTLRSDKPIELFKWEFKSKEEKIDNLRNKNKEKRKKKKNKKKKEKKEKQKRFDRLEYLREKQKKIDAGIEKKERIESSIQTGLAQIREQIEEKRELNKKLKSNSEKIKANVLKNKKIKEDNKKEKNKINNILREIKKQKNINYKGYRSVCKQHAKRYDQETGLDEFRRDMQKKQIELPWNPYAEECADNRPKVHF